MKRQSAKAVVILSMLVLAGGCATERIAVKPFDTVATVESDFDATWEELVRFLSTNQIGIKTIEKDSGLVVMENLNMSPNLIQEYCTNIQIPLMWSLQSGKASGNVTVDEDDGFTTVAVNMSYQATTQFCYDGCSYNTARCDSTGKFETELLDAVQ